MNKVLKWTLILVAIVIIAPVALKALFGLSMFLGALFGLLVFAAIIIRIARRVGRL